MAVFLGGPAELKSERRGWHSKFAAEALGNASTEDAAAQLTLVTIQYNRTASLRAMATLAMFRCRRSAKCAYRRLQPASHRAAAWAASPNKKRSRVLPCLVMCPSR
jgi:hypothetical protein